MLYSPLSRVLADRESEAMINPVMGREEASISGVVLAAFFALVATTGHLLFAQGHEIAWLCLFGCSIATFFASFKAPQDERKLD